MKAMVFYWYFIVIMYGYCVGTIIGIQFGILSIFYWYYIWCLTSILLLFLGYYFSIVLVYIWYFISILLVFYWYFIVIICTIITNIGRIYEG